MRFILFFIIFCLSVNSITAQINLSKLKYASGKAQEIINSNHISQDEVIKGLREALSLGVINSTESASKAGGFNQNNLIKIHFPKDAQEIKNTLIKLGLQSQVNKFEHVMNETAEDASNFAKDIFLNVVKNMTIDDAMSILKGNDNSATVYLESKTSKLLFTRFKPIVKKSIYSFDLTKYWNILIERYNAIPLTKKVDIDLEDYVTNQAIIGLFILIAQEEKDIRNNPDARVSEILQKVFK